MIGQNMVIAVEGNWTGSEISLTRSAVRGFHFIRVKYHIFYSTV